MKPTELHEEPECVEIFTNRYQIWSGATLKCYRLDVVLISQAHARMQQGCMCLYLLCDFRVCLFVSLPQLTATATTCTYICH